MKRSPKVEIHDAPDGVAFAIVLAADYTAEHEWGFERIGSILGQRRDAEAGLERYRCSDAAAFARNHAWRTGTLTTSVDVGDGKWAKRKFSHTTLVVDGDLGWSGGKVDDHLIGRPYDLETDFTGAWSDRGFAVTAWNAAAAGRLAELAAAFADGNLCLWTAGGGVFKNPGLVVAAFDRIPEHISTTVRDAHLETARLREATAATGIEETLTGAGLSWFALSPRWADGFRDLETEHPVVFWLNPRNQGANNHGWFTVEQLEAWSRGEGPVPKEAAGVGLRR
jgi:hypothetical protein